MSTSSTQRKNKTTLEISTICCTTHELPEASNPSMHILHAVSDAPRHADAVTSGAAQIVQFEQMLPFFHWAPVQFMLLPCALSNMRDMLRRANTSCVYIVRRGPLPMKCLDLIFDDKRLAIIVLMMWLLVVIVSLQSIDLMHAEFMTFGPTPHTKFMTVSIDTWHKWWMLTIATVANTCVSDFMSDAIVPWLQNTVQDHKTKYLPYRKFTCYMISQLWGTYCNVMSIFAIGLMTSQIDFLAVRMLADLITNTFTCFKFMRNKVVDKAKYNMWNEDRIQDVSVMLDGSMVDMQMEMVQPLTKGCSESQV